jgi:hypothetical protein
MMFQCVADSGRFADPDDPVISPWLWDARPVRLGKSRDEIVADLFESTTEIIAPTVVLMDCEFDTRGVRGVCETKGIRYLTPGSHVGKQGRIERLDRSNVDVFPDTEDSLAPTVKSCTSAPSRTRFRRRSPAARKQMRTARSSWTSGDSWRTQLKRILALSRNGKTGRRGAHLTR